MPFTAFKVPSIASCTVDPNSAGVNVALTIATRPNMVSGRSCVSVRVIKLCFFYITRNHIASKAMQFLYTIQVCFFIGYLFLGIIYCVTVSVSNDFGGL